MKTAASATASQKHSGSTPKTYQPSLSSSPELVFPSPCYWRSQNQTLNFSRWPKLASTLVIGLFSARQMERCRITPVASSSSTLLGQRGVSSSSSLAGASSHRYPLHTFDAFPKDRPVDPERPGLRRNMWSALQMGRGRARKDHVCLQ